MQIRVAMKMEKLLEKLYFHDSSLDDFRFDFQNNLLEIQVSFCLWMQTFYDDKWPECIDLRITFNDVKNLVIDSVADDIKDNEILSFELSNDVKAKMLLYGKKEISIVSFESTNCELMIEDYVWKSMNDKNTEN